MTGEKTEKQNRVREALGRLYEEYPPYFREYLRRYEEDPTSRVFAPLAEAYRKMGRLEDAILVCREGLEHHPEFHGGRVALAKCLAEKGDKGAARVELERVIRVAPENLLAQRLMGDVCKDLGDTVTALHAYKMALLLAPNDVILAERVHELEHSSNVFMHSGGISPDGNVPVAAAAHVSAPVPAAPAVDPMNPRVPSTDHLANFENDLPPLWASQNGVPMGAGLEVDTIQPLQPQDFDEPSEGSSLLSSLPMDPLLADDDIDDEGFKIEHISAIFDAEAQRKKEITTETLADLYFSQGQFERALKIFDKLPRTPELARKVRECKMRLGVDENHLKRSRELALLRSVLQKAQSKS